MMNNIETGKTVVFLCDMGYKNPSGKVKYDVRVGSKGIVQEVHEEGDLVYYDIKLLAGKTLEHKDILEKIPAKYVEEVVGSFLEEVEEFPRRPKKSRPWRKFSTELLETFANNNDIVWTENENPKVNRMFLVKALDDSGIEPPKDEKELLSRKTAGRKGA